MVYVGVILALCAACTHAAWALSSAPLAALRTSSVVFASSVVAFTLLTPVILVFYGSDLFPVTAHQATWYLGSIVINLAYLLAMQTTYKLGAAAYVYPLARGSSPIFVVCLSLVFLGLTLSVLGFVGLMLILAGVWIASWSALSHTPSDVRPSTMSAPAAALVAGLLIASCSIWDQHAIGSAGIEPLVLIWVDNAGRVLVMSPLLRSAGVRADLGRAWRMHRRSLLIVCATMDIPYIFYLYALSVAPAVLVSPIRELSVILVVLFSRWHQAMAKMFYSQIVSVFLFIAGAILMSFQFV